MGAGKSTLGKQIAEILLMNFVDMDAYIECMQRTSIQNLFDNEGEEQFRKIEQYYLMRLSKLNHTVISCGGGVPCFYNNMQHMLKTGLVVYIKQPEDVLCHRLSQQGGNRPVLKGIDATQLASFIQKHLREREPFYAQAQITFYAQQNSVEELVDRINLFYESR